MKQKRRKPMMSSDGLCLAVISCDLEYLLHLSVCCASDKIFVHMACLTDRGGPQTSRPGWLEVSWRCWDWYCMFARHHWLQLRL